MNKISDLILRPNREIYTEKDLGPKTFQLKDRIFNRTDLQIKNERNMTLQSSFFEPVKRSKPKMPCIVYCHGNSGSRLDCFEPVEQILMKDFSAFVFDFSGSGISDGEYVSLGYYEQLDIKAVVEYLKNSDKVSSISLWGRSMGAVSCLLYASQLLDSAFSNLKKIILDIVQKIKLVPNFLGKYVYNKARSQILKRANFDIDEIDPLKSASKCKIPAFFIHGTADELVEIGHSYELMKKYEGENQILEIKDTNHNASRPN